MPGPISIRIATGARLSREEVNRRGARKNTRSLQEGRLWHIDKKVRGYRIRERTGTNNLTEAERYLARRVEQTRDAAIYGIRPQRTFRQAATKYLIEVEKATLSNDVIYLRLLDPFIGDLPLESVHMGSLQPFIEARKKDGVKRRTINAGLRVAHQVLNRAASEWFYDNGMTWLAAVPNIRLLPETDRRKPYPLSWEEQNRLFSQLPYHLAKMAPFKVSTG
jgi:hypothetical protein